MAAVLGTGVAIISRHGLTIEIYNRNNNWGRNVVKPGGASRQTRKYFYGKK